MTAGESRGPGILEHTPPKLAEVIASYNNNACTAEQAAQEAIELGNLSIGCAQPAAVHEPRASHKYYDLATREWRLVDDTELPRLRATNDPVAAILCGLIHDYNNPLERQNLGEEPLTDLEPPHFGWAPDSTTHHARPGILNKLLYRGPKHRGCIDFVRHDASFTPVLIEPRHFTSRFPHQTLGSLLIDVTDLPKSIKTIHYKENI